MNLIPYRPTHQELWNHAVSTSRNGTFLLSRPFMDYHAQRFTDCSLLFMRGDKVLGLLPANITPDGTVHSHQGLTYGGLILMPWTVATDTLQMLDEAIRYYRDTLHANTFIYKPVPHIYSTETSDDALYALYRHGFQLKARGLSATITTAAHPTMQTLRLRGVHKAQRADVRIQREDDVTPFWHLLDSVLQSRHHVHPVHTPDEMHLLMHRFPHHIQHFTARAKDGTLLAGTWIFVTPQVAHFQYIATSDQGRQCGALDLLFHHLITHQFADHPYIDFGISTEQDGHHLNEGLTFQKEGFGARGTTYDTYQLTL